MRKKFFQLPLQRQIQLGVMSVSCCVCLMIFIILLTSTLIMVNLTYTDFANMIYKKENQQLDQIALFFDIKSNVITETTKYSIQWIRNFLRNNNDNQDFMNNLKYIDIHKNLKNIDESQNYFDCDFNNKSNNCIFYKILHSDTNLSKTSEFQNYLKILTISIPIIQKTFSYRFQDSDENSIFNSFLIYSNKFKTIFIYKPEKGIKIEDFFDSSYTIDHLNYYLNISAYFLHANLKKEESSLSTYDSITEFLMKNPDQSYLVISQTKIPYYNLKETSSTLISTMSFNYENLQTLDDIKNEYKLIDIVQGDWSTDLIDQISWNSVKSYKGTKVIVADSSNYIITPTNCHFLIKFYEMMNGYTNYTLGSVPYNPNFVKDCVIYKPSNISFIELMGMNPNHTDYSEIKRRIHIPIFNGWKDKNDYSDTRFKIIRYATPDYQTKVFMDTFFSFVTRTNQYMFKNTKFLEKSIKKIWDFFVRIIIFIFFYNLMTWYICMLIVIIIVWKVSKDITTPIDRLIEEVTKLGGGELNKSEDKSSVENIDQIPSESPRSEIDISYPDDGDINEMFKICESLIKGGFMENGTNIPKKGENTNLIISHNNVAFVKTNDLIILEDFIEHHANNNKSIFSWPKEKPNKKVESKDYNTDASENLNLNSINKNYSSEENNLLMLNKMNINENPFIKKEKKNYLNGGFWQTKISDKRINALKKENSNNNFNLKKSNLDILNYYSDILQVNTDKFLEDYIKNLVAEHDNKRNFLNLKKDKDKKKETSSIDKIDSNRLETENKESEQDNIFNSKISYLNSLFLDKTNNGISLFLDVY